MRLVLASASPRRAELLRAAGFGFETRPVDLNEAVHPGEAAPDYVRRLAREKSALAAQQLGQTEVEQLVVLGADTVVVIDGQILGKPGDDERAGSMLRQLGGRAHQVLTGVSLRMGAREAGRVESTTVHFAPLDEETVAWYVATGEGRDKAGAYAIQGLASRFIPRIEGSYSNVVGLPIAAVVELLAALHPERSRAILNV